MFGVLGDNPTEALFLVHVSQSLAITQNVIYDNSITAQGRNLVFKLYFYSATAFSDR